MRARPHPRGGGRHGATGVGMIEVLVGMMVVALWLLSNVGLSLNSLRFQRSADSRMTAISLASELGERMETNYRGAQSGSYALPATRTVSATAPDCAAQVCQPADIAAYDLAQWTRRAVAALNLSEVSVTDTTPVGGVTTYTIRLVWEEPGSRPSPGGDRAPAEVMSYVTTKLVRNEAL